MAPPPPAPSPYRGRSWGKKSAGVGLLAFVASVAANVLMALGFMPLVPVMRTAIAMARQGQQLTATQIQQMVDASAIGLYLNLGFWVGVVGFVMGIVAIVANRGRGWGVVTLLVSILGPILVIMYWSALAVQ